MAEPVALGIKPPQVMTLGDMVNIARGAQAYQQAEQANPLALQKAQMEIDQAQKMNPLAVSRSETELEKARIDALKAGYGLDDTEHSSFAKILGGFAYDPRLKPENIKKNPSAVMDVIHEMKAEGVASGIRNKRLDTVIAPAMAKAMQDPSSVPQYLLNMMTKGMTSAEQRSAGLEKVETTGAGQVIRTTPSTYGETPKVSYETPSGVTPMPNIVVVNGAQYEISPPTTAGGQPILKPLGGGMTQQQGGTQQNVVPPPSGGQPQGVTPTQMSLPYPVRRAGDVRPYAPSEKYDEEKGQAYRDTLANEARNLTTYRRSTDEVIREAEKIGKEEWNQGAGFMGKMGRNFSTFLGTEQGVAYKNLSKSLANVQLNSMKALGLSTDADKTLGAAANGDYTYPPEVLTKIASQAHGNMTNIELQTKGAEAFAKKYGDSNQKTFQDLWNSNSKDTRVFEAIAINDSNIPQKEKIKRIDKLLENMSPTEIDALTKSKNRLLKLSKTGEL
jgi:hypothetical protein